MHAQHRGGRHLVSTEGLLNVSQIVCSVCGLPKNTWGRHDPRVCIGCYKREWRKDPQNAERDRQWSRRWKREHLGQPGMPR